MGIINVQTPHHSALSIPITVGPHGGQMMFSSSTMNAEMLKEMKDMSERPDGLSSTRAAFD
jgi:hypothetical protein